MASPCQVLAKYLSTACHLRIDGMWSKMPAEVCKSPVARKRHDAQALKLRRNERGEVLVRLWWTSAHNHSVFRKNVVLLPIQNL